MEGREPQVAYNAITQLNNVAVFVNSSPGNKHLEGLVLVVVSAIYGSHSPTGFSTPSSLKKTGDCVLSRASAADTLGGLAKNPGNVEGLTTGSNGCQRELERGGATPTVAPKEMKYFITPQMAFSNYF